MIGEVAHGLLGVFGILLALIASTFWMLGGRSNEELDKTWFGLFPNRFWGRWVAPLLFASSMVWLSTLGGSYRHFFWLALPAYWAASTMGYGGKTFAKKFFRRTLWSLVTTACCLVFVLWTNQWTIYLTQAAVGWLMAVVWGIRNPQIAPREELVIRFSNVFLVPFTVL